MRKEPCTDWVLAQAVQSIVQLSSDYSCSMAYLKGKVTLQGALSQPPRCGSGHKVGRELHALQCSQIFGLRQQRDYKTQSN